MTDKEDHRVLANEINTRHTWQINGYQEARQATQDGCGVDDGNERISRKLIARHRVRAIVEHDITYDKQQNEEERKSDCRLPAPTSHQSAPLAAQFKEEDSHEHITQTQEQGIVQSKKPIADEREEEIETGTIVLNHGRGTPEETMAPFFEKVDSNVGSKEANQEPCRIITIKAAVHPDM